MNVSSLNQADIQFYVILLTIFFTFVLTFSTLGVLLAVLSWTKVQALEKSTHTVQMVPIDEEIDKANRDYMEQWATSQKSLEEQAKMDIEDRDDLMPEFASSEEDKKTYTF